MSPVILEGMNCCLAPPRKMPDGQTCQPLMAYRTKTGYVSAWKLSDEDLQHLLAHGIVLLHITGDGHPPVWMQVEPELPPEVPA